MRNSIFPKREPGSNSWLLSFSWEQRKLEMLASFSKGAGYSKNDLLSSGTPIILYGRLYTKYETNITIVDTFVAAKSGSIYSRGGEVIVPASGETAEDISIAAVVENKGVILGGDLNIITPGKDLDPTFLALTISFGNAHKELSRFAQGKSVVHLHNADLKIADISYPKCKEQQKIGAFFQTLDRLITLHQRNDFFVKAPKNLEISLQKTVAWEQREFENSFSLLQNNTLSRSELSESPGVAANIHYGDVLIKFGEYLDIEEETFPWIKKQTDADKFKMSFLQDGDIVFADTAEDETAGKCCEIRNCGSTVIISGLHTIPCRPESKFAPGYLGYYLNSTAFHEQLIPLMQGTKVVSISKTALKSTNIQYPSDDKEQQKIGQFFRGLDRLITLHQRERLFLILEEILC